MTFNGRLGQILVGLYVAYLGLLTFVPALGGIALLMAIVAVAGGLLLAAGR